MIALGDLAAVAVAATAAFTVGIAIGELLFKRLSADHRNVAPPVDHCYDSGSVPTAAFAEYREYAARHGYDPADAAGGPTADADVDVDVDADYDHDPDITPEHLSGEWTLGEVDAPDHDAVGDDTSDADTESDHE